MSDQQRVSIYIYIPGSAQTLVRKFIPEKKCQEKYKITRYTLKLGTKSASPQMEIPLVSWSAIDPTVVYNDK